MTLDRPTVAPPLRTILWRLLWMSAIGGLVVALLLAIVGTIAAGGDAGLFVSLIPAMIAIGVGMAIPPVLGAGVGLAIVARPPRTLRREQWAAVIGGAVGAFVSPVIFYSASLVLAVVVGLAITVVAAIGYPLVIRSLWRRAAAV